MAKDDYHVIVSKILVYLYKKYKQMEVDLNYIKGECIEIKEWNGDIVLVDYANLKITPAGIEYLKENSIIKKIWVYNPPISAGRTPD